MTIFQQRAEELARHFAALPEVVAVALGGSQASSTADDASDIDLYIYTDGQIDLEARTQLIEQAGGATRTNLDLPYWGGVNMWVDALTSITVDCMLFEASWMEQEIERVLEQHQPGLGYSTCFCRTVHHSHVLHDPRGWFANLQARTNRPYPEALRRNIIAHNYPVLRTIIPSYLHQIENAVRRNDLLSINHRVAALLASYFDILFALNRVLHPGEKRLLIFAQQACSLLPVDINKDIPVVLQASATANTTLISALNQLLDRLDALLHTAADDL